MLEPLYSPEPKSGWTVSVIPIKLMIAAEFGSTVAFAIFWFHALSGGKGRKPLRLPPCPRLMPLHASGGGLPPVEVTVTLTEPDVLLPGFGLLTETANVPAVVAEPVAVSCIDET